MSKSIKFKDDSKAYFFQGQASYWIVYDYGSGSPNRYDVFILTSGDPVRIGCELPLEFCKSIIRDYEILFKKRPELYLGNRNAMLSARKMVSNLRKKG